MKVLKESSGFLDQQANIAGKKSLIAGLLGITLFLVSIGLSSYTGLALFGILASLGLLWFSYIQLKSFGRWKRGKRGEKAVTNKLLSLDNTYYLINDVKLPGQQGNIDHVVVGPCGVFAIETKNYSGSVICYGDKWYQGRHTWLLPPRRRFPISSISSQARGNAVRLANSLRNRGFNVWVQPIVVFSGRWTRLWLRNPTVPVVKLSKLPSFLTVGEVELTDKYNAALSDAILSLATTALKQSMPGLSGPENASPPLSKPLL